MRRRRATKKKTRGKRANKRTRRGAGSCANPNVPCNFLDKHYTGFNKQNETWDTCIKMNNINNHIIYVTSQNVLIKSIESLQVPEFMVTLAGSRKPEPCKLKIEDKYVACFLKVCGEWYVIMRLFGKTINTGALALTETNKAFYKITGIDIDANNPDTSTSSITIPSECYSEIDESLKFATSKTKIIQLADKCFTNINKKNDVDVFNVLQRFRQQKMFASAEKSEVAQEVVKDAALFELVNFL